MMTSLLIIGRNKSTRETYADAICIKERIGSFDKTIISKESSAKLQKQSIGIEDILQMQKAVMLKPVESEWKAVILHDAHLLTIEAQNALLKLLEEPPKHTYIILTAESKEVFLPTILSRCKIIQLSDENDQAVDEKEKQEIKTLIESLPNLSVALCLAKAEEMAKEKEKLLLSLCQMILLCRELVLEDIASDGGETHYHFSLLSQLQSLYTLLRTTNVTARLALERFFLSFL